jgi:hypothetical protein
MPQLPLCFYLHLIPFTAATHALTVYIAILIEAVNQSSLKFNTEKPVQSLSLVKQKVTETSSNTQKLSS